MKVMSADYPRGVGGPGPAPGRKGRYYGRSYTNKYELDGL